MSQINPYYTRQQQDNSMAPMQAYLDYLATGRMPGQQSMPQWKNPVAAMRTIPIEDIQSAPSAPPNPFSAPRYSAPYASIGYSTPTPGNPQPATNPFLNTAPTDGKA